MPSSPSRPSQRLGELLDEGSPQRRSGNRDTADLGSAVAAEHDHQGRGEQRHDLLLLGIDVGSGTDPAS
jgi:hypothetical protein